MVSLMAKDIMNPDVLSVGPDWSIGQLADFLCANSISGAPVISEDNKLMGPWTFMPTEWNGPRKRSCSVSIPSFILI